MFHRALPLAALALALPAAAHAHEGHGEIGQAHWLTQPDHLLAIAVVVAAGAALGFAAWQRRVAKRTALAPKRRD